MLSVLCFPLVLLLTTTKSYCEADRQRVPRRLVMAGGYSPVEEFDDEQIHAAAVMAVQTLRVGGAASYSFIPNLPTQLDAASDVRIIRAFSQVVAGLNYRLILAVTPASDAGGACLGAFAVEIYNHFGELSVTTWGQEIDCKTAMASLQNPDLLNSPLGKVFHGRKKIRCK